MKKPALDSQLQCPSCGHSEMMAMATDACLFFHTCAACRITLRPKAGDCCVFCSYGTVPCPPVQVTGPNAGCCSSNSAASFCNDWN